MSAGTIGSTIVWFREGFGNLSNYSNGLPYDPK